MIICTEISLDEWQLLCGKVGFLDLFASSNYISSQVAAFNLKNRHYLVLKGEDPQVLLTVFCKGKSIALPVQYTYTAIWLNKAVSENSITDSVRLLLKFLKEKHNRICLKLPIEIADARPFKWEGFRADVRYTYLKDLGSLEYHPNIKRILAKYNDDYDFRVNVWEEDVREFLLNDLKLYKIQSSIANSVLDFFAKVFEEGNLLVASAYAENEIVAANLITLDKPSRKAYFFIISKTGQRAKDTGLPAYMYDFCFKHLTDAGIEIADLAGANMPEIAHFKAKYNPALTPYFEVRYDSKLSALSRRIPFIKRIGRWLPH